MKRKKGLLDEERFLPPLPEQLPRGVSSLPGYGQTSPVAQGLLGFTGRNPTYSVMDPQAQQMSDAYRLGEQVSVASQLYGSMLPFAAASTMAKAGQIPGASMAVKQSAKAPTNMTRLYHGTDREFKKFDIDKASHNVNGIWLTDDPGYADWISRKGNNKNKSGIVMPLDVDIKNPMEYDIFKEANNVADMAGLPAPQTALEAQELLAGGMGWDSVVSDLVHEARLKGHDALKLKRFNDNYGHETTAYVVFDPAKINLADPDITKAAGGAVHMKASSKLPEYGSAIAGLLSPAVLEYLRRRDEEGM